MPSTNLRRIKAKEKLNPYNEVRFGPKDFAVVSSTTSGDASVNNLHAIDNIPSHKDGLPRRRPPLFGNACYRTADCNKKGVRPLPGSHSRAFIPPPRRAAPHRRFPLLDAGKSDH